VHHAFKLMFVPEWAANKKFLGGLFYEEVMPFGIHSFKFNLSSYLCGWFKGA